MSALIDISGQKFGRLKVISLSGRNKWKKAIWKCQCDCGKTVDVLSNGLRAGETNSCGCIVLTRGGKSHSREWKSWHGMIRRCENPNVRIFKYYGGRGIKVCGKWKSFDEFLKDMGPRPPGTSLDRINNDGDYEKENCRWANRRTQAINKRNNVRITVDGVCLTQTEWASKLGVPDVTICSRIKRGWSTEKAVTTPRIIHAKAKRL